MTPPAQTLTLFDFEEHLAEEWLIPPAVLWANRAEIFSLYCEGYTTREVAEYLQEKSNEEES